MTIKCYDVGMKTPPSHRHFPYQHPTFGTKAKPAPVSKWKNTVYHYWWAYLRRNPFYIQTCESGGSGPFSELYKDFGDVRGDDFKAWWSEGSRGMRLFAEPRAEDVVRVLHEGDVALSPLEALTVSFPLNLPKRLLERRFKVLLAEHHKGQRGRQYAKMSKAKFRIQGQPNIPSLDLALEVWDLRQARPDLSLWEIGNRIPRLLRSQKMISNSVDELSSDQKRAIASAASRYIKRVNLTIGGVAVGIFP